MHRVEVSPPALPVTMQTEMRIGVSDESVLRDLVAFLTEDEETVVTRVDEHRIDVGFVGSFNAEAQLMEAELRVRAWMAAHPDAVVVVSE